MAIASAAKPGAAGRHHQPGEREAGFTLVGERETGCTLVGT